MVVMVVRHFWRENGLKRGKENERDPDFIVVREICPLGEPGPDSFDLEGGGSLNFDSNFVFREKKLFWCRRDAGNFKSPRRRDGRCKHAAIFWGKNKLLSPIWLEI